MIFLILFLLAKISPKLTNDRQNPQIVRRIHFGNLRELFQNQQLQLQFRQTSRKKMTNIVPRRVRMRAIYLSCWLKEEVQVHCSSLAEENTLLSSCEMEKCLRNMPDSDILVIKCCVKGKRFELCDIKFLRTKESTF